MSTTATKQPKGFKFLTGDVNWLDYGGVWARHIDGQRYHFIELINMDEACGRDNEGRYIVELVEVDLSEVPPAEMRRALWNAVDCANGRKSEAEMTIADALRSYGIAAPLHSESTNNAHKGIAECRKESYRLTRDTRAYEDAMGQPVNRLGSTAREFGRGDLNSALLRGLEKGSKDARIMAKMYIATDGQTLGGKLSAKDLHEITKAYVKGSEV